MENIQAKAGFLQHEYTKKLEQIDPATTGKWGRMNVQQMIEHMADYFRIGSGKDPQKLVTAEEHIPRMHAFLASEKPFKENTPNSLMPDTPPPAKYASIQPAIEELQHEIDHFFEVFKIDTSKTVTNPFFGDLGYDMSVQLLHKHALHHLRQFGAVE